MGGNGNGRHKNEQKYIEMYTMTQQSIIIISILMFILSTTFFWNEYTQDDLIGGFGWMLIAFGIVGFLIGYCGEIKPHKIPIID